jgi:hypothetical protein
VNALILYSKNVELIDDVIREYAINVSSELNNNPSLPPVNNSPNTLNDRKTSTSDLNELKNQQHTCIHCPMQQFINLCEYLNKFDTRKSPELVYDIIIDKLNYNLDLIDQNYLFNLIDEFKFEIKFSSVNANNNSETNLTDINLFLIALIHKLCLKKQNQHLIDIQNGKTGINSFNLMLIKQSMSSHLSKINGEKIESGGSKLLLRSNTIDSSNVRTLNAIATGATNHGMNKSNSKLINMLKVKSSKQHQHPLTSRVRAIAGDKSSLRKTIFNKIVAGGCNMSFTSPSADGKATTKRFKNSQDVRQLWKKLISEQIILNKMEKENLSMARESQRERSQEAIVDNKCTNYMEITPCLKESDSVWESFLNDKEKKCDIDKDILQMVLKGKEQNQLSINKI